MSRGLENDSYYVSRGGMIPVKWTAPEASHVAKKQSKTSVLESTIMIRLVYLYLSVPRKCILLGKHFISWGQCSGFYTNVCNLYPPMRAEIASYVEVYMYTYLGMLRLLCIGSSLQEVLQLK